jgi:hypothetical protein
VRRSKSAHAAERNSSSVMISMPIEASTFAACSVPLRPIDIPVLATDYIRSLVAASALIPVAPYTPSACLIGRVK